MKPFIILSIARISSDMLSRETVHQYLTEDFPPRYVVPQKNDSIYGLARSLTQVSLGLLGSEKEGKSWLVSAVLD